MEIEDKPMQPTALSVGADTAPAPLGLNERLQQKKLAAKRELDAIEELEQLLQEQQKTKRIMELTQSLGLGYY